MEKELGFEVCKRCGIKSMAARMLNDNELEQLSDSCAEVDFKKGDIIIKQGALSSNVIYVKTNICSSSGHRYWVWDGTINGI